MNYNKGHVHTLVRFSLTANYNKCHVHTLVRFSLTVNYNKCHVHTLVGTANAFDMQPLFLVFVFEM